MKLYTRFSALLFAGAAVVFATGQAAAETYYYSAVQAYSYGKDVKLSESLSYVDANDVTQYFWFTLGDDGTTKNWCTTLPDFTDTTSTFHIGYDADNKSGKVSKAFIVDTDFTPGILNVWMSPSTIQVLDGVNLTINELKSGSYSAGFSGANTQISVANITKGKWGDGFIFGVRANPIKKITVTDTWIVAGSGGGYWTSIYAGDGTGTIDNPDIVVNKMKGTGTYAMLSYGLQHQNQSKTALLDLNSVFSVNAITEGSGFYVSGSTASVGSLTVVLTNNQDASSYGSMWEGYYNTTTGYSLKDGGAKLALVMKGGKDSDGKYYSQSFTGVNLAWTGGIQMLSGKLCVNYASNALGLSHGTLTFNQSDGEVASFGSTGMIGGGTFLFNDIKVENGGVLISRFDGTRASEDFVIDTIALSTGGISGSGTLTIDFSVDEIALFELVRDSVENGVKIISWNSGETNTAIINTKYMTITDDNLQDYVFKTYNGDDGLYVAYVAVPEPATVAAIFGAFALGIAAWRRRK